MKKEKWIAILMAILFSVMYVYSQSGQGDSSSVDSSKVVDSTTVTSTTTSSSTDTQEAEPQRVISLSEKMGPIIADLNYFDVLIYFFQLVLLLMGTGLTIFYLTLFNKKKFLLNLKELIRISAIKEAGADIYQLIDFEIANLQNKYSFIDFLTSASPLSGLLGTIIGLVKVFKSQAYVGTVSMKTLSSGMYVAMVTTATGLTVALIGMIYGHLLDNKIANIRLFLAESLIRKDSDEETE